MEQSEPNKQHVRIMRWLLALFFASAGVVHIVSPGAFLPIVPEWVPAPEATVMVTGLCEIAGAAGVLIPRFRRFAGYMLALYTVCVYPANIKHAVEGIAMLGTVQGWTYHVPRLALQPVILWWCLYATRITGWPFTRRPHGARL